MSFAWREVRDQIMHSASTLNFQRSFDAVRRDRDTVMPFRDPAALLDALHQKAGSREVLELHGSVLRNYCTRCGKFYGLDAILNSTGVPKCTCGGTIKPDVVLYEEGLDQETIEKSVKYIANADVLIIGGTSLTVYPAAGLIDYYRGHKLVLINKSVTPMDNRADLVISGPIGEVLGDAVGV